MSNGVHFADETVFDPCFALKASKEQSFKVFLKRGSVCESEVTFHDQRHAEYKESLSNDNGLAVHIEIGRETKKCTVGLVQLIHNTPPTFQIKNCRMSDPSSLQGSYYKLLVQV